jgi:protein tyrosine phosphatase (PTP) superfamily phosphohydrolase (DUF442 family)
MSLVDIINYYKIDARLATSGQPTVEQLQQIADAGYQIIINLAPCSSSNAIAEEDAIVTNLGIVYVHIPVIWEHPTLKDVRLFFKIMETFSDTKVWVHCAKNMRVSCFIYLWQKYVLQLAEDTALYPMQSIWSPQGVWQQLIEEAGTLNIQRSILITKPIDK